MSSPSTWLIEVFPKEASGSNGEPDPRSRALAGEIGLLGWSRTPRVLVTDLYFIRDSSAAPPSGRIDRQRLESIVPALFADLITQSFRVTELKRETHPGKQQLTEASSASHRATVLKRPGVMDPVESSALRGLRDLDLDGLAVSTALRCYFFDVSLDASKKESLASQVLSNPVIETVVWDDAVVDPSFAIDAEDRVQKRLVPLDGLSPEELLEISNQGQLSLNLKEMEAIRDHFRLAGRPPVDVELETLAQTWSEHCCHKTLRGIIDFRRIEPDGRETRATIDNLLRQTIRRATETIAAPWCLSVFEDNAGVVAFDDTYGLSFKVETHNHPSAIEPYGGAGTGIGGVIRDTLGTGLGAKPIVNTDVFCFGPLETPGEKVPAGCLHPLRVLRGVVSGVRDYGNRMGIPTASGAIYFDERYIGNPLVYCGSVGILPQSAIKKEVRSGDRVYVVGGRTGRDGIHGATFSSVELTEQSEVISSGAVQIGNAITEKRVLDFLLEARDRGLYRSVTDCGAGGLSSAVGEMGARTGARVFLEKVPLKYEGLTYTEIWISEAQERMVVAVPPENVEELERLAQSEEVECTDIGEFTDRGYLELFHRGVQVADLEMEFLHHGIPRLARPALYTVPFPEDAHYPDIRIEVGGAELGAALKRLLAAPNIASKEWVIRQYDHEVQGQSVLKPLQGPGRGGPGDAVAFAPRFDSDRAVVIGCGMNPCYGDLDPYRMAKAAVDEALRNVVAVGGDPQRTALLDNFAWGNTRRPEILGALVEAAQGCHDAAVGFGTPFISGKDSLNNEFQVQGKSINVPPSLLISSLSVIDDAHRLISMDLKQPGHSLLLVGETKEELGGSHYFRVCGGSGGEVPDLVFPDARQIHAAVHKIIARGQVVSAHDLSEGGLAVAAAEMAFAGGVGCEIRLDRVPVAESLTREAGLLFSESNSRFILEVPADQVAEVLDTLHGLPAACIGRVLNDPVLRVLGLQGQVLIAESLDELGRSWRSLTDFLATS